MDAAREEPLETATKLVTLPSTKYGLCAGAESVFGSALLSLKFAQTHTSYA
jgi:hypothetical protein